MVGVLDVFDPEDVVVADVLVVLLVDVVDRVRVVHENNYLRFGGEVEARWELVVVEVD